MKKNKMMRLASAMMVLTLMSTSVISGTFAKYVTSDEAADTARVAKFGVVVTADGSLFADTYKTTANTPGEDSDNNETHLSVVSKAEDNVVAPGTKNTTGITFSITGEPEVDCRIDVVVAGMTTDGKFDKDGEIADVCLPKKDGYDNLTTGDDTDKFNLADDYYPVIYKLTGNLKGADGQPLKDNEDNLVTEISGNLAKIKTALENLSTVKVDANTNLETQFGNYTLTWEWPYESGHDEADTYLGNVAAEKKADATAKTNIEFGLKVTVTQID